MAFNWQTFRTRTLTAIVFAVIMLLGLFWNPWSFLVLFSIIHFGCWWEYLKLTEKIHNITFHSYTKLGLMVMGYGLMLWFCSPAFHINSYGLKENISLPVSAAGFTLLLIGIFQKNAIPLKAFSMAVLGLVYISLCWGLMINFYDVFFLHRQNFIFIVEPKAISILIIVSIWINDTMAYIMGSLIGKTPLSEISPKKTWEGTISGIIVSVSVVGLISYVGFHVGSFIWHVVIIAAIAAITGTFGDLLESKLKRMAGLKDSGSLMPGHGGFLDRFDSLLLSTPFVWGYVYFFMK